LSSTIVGPTYTVTRVKHCGPTFLLRGVSSGRFAALWAPPLAKTWAKKAGISLRSIRVNRLASLAGCSQADLPYPATFFIVAFPREPRLAAGRLLEKRPQKSKISDGLASAKRLRTSVALA